ncbi:cupin domain-containing protein [Enterovibrio sp. ZSDZ42]|uniref:Cupin domain-containing protein n=1 Tax=Enterovibrio gelatinilyticus TaxID=2899819 RepID=A0ABT5R0S9_9GAMM|nr:cupin domain-containing protein [Enterovibrio sp. ZSDZ42]MDD1793770.1 cupin domain-containing protein [Enterovibrio sp. ZSDZ42]
MKNLTTLSKGNNHCAVSPGRLDAIGQFTFTHEAVPFKIEGKVFVSEALGMSGGILSLNKLAPHASMPFHHTHIEHEEIYIFIDGKGEVMIDNDRFEVEPGSVVRVAPEGVRCWRNLADEPLYYAVLQVKKGEKVIKTTIEDGRGVDRPVVW